MEACYWIFMPTTIDFAPATAGIRRAGYFQWPIPDDAGSFYGENGFLVLENALSRREIDGLLRETVRICRNANGGTPAATSAGDGESEEALLKRMLCIHFPHKISQVALETLAHPRIVEVLTRIVGPNVKAMQSMLFIKASGKPGQAWHQDEDYIPTRDCSLTGVWIALDDAVIENGCLWVIPGSHKFRTLWPQEWHEDARFDCAWQSHDFPFSDDDAVPVEVKAGSVVFFNGYTLHRSLPNRSAGAYRRALVNHYMSAESLLPWRLPGTGEHMATADYRDIVMVAGTDPHAYKGLASLAQPHVRPAGDGGCEKWGGPDHRG